MQFSGDLISHGHSRRRANTCFTIHTNIRLLSSYSLTDYRWIQKRIF